MSGIYLHIPFCKSRCIYCGFYSTTLLPLRQRYVDALCQEIAAGPALSDLRTLYLGGGTPSMLSESQLAQLFRALYNRYGAAMTADMEITMECNPDDVTPQFTAMLTRLPINRVSMGAQTFSEERLRFIGRRHSAHQTATAVCCLRQAGISNISIDLMYGFPQETLEQWENDIRQAMALNVEHLSAYGLMVEEGTPLAQMVERGEVKEIDEELSRQMYYTLIDRLTAAGYDHYEISNFARPGRRSRHNSAYWSQTPYLGFGAAAHSFSGHKRWWNVSDVKQYMEGIESGKPKREAETIDRRTRYNEWVMTALRTSDGLPLNRLTPREQRYCLRQAQPFIEGGLLTHHANRLTLTREGLYVSDMVMEKLFFI